MDSPPILIGDLSPQADLSEHLSTRIRFSLVSWDLFRTRAHPLLTALFVALGCRLLTNNGIMLMDGHPGQLHGDHTKYIWIYVSPVGDDLRGVRSLPLGSFGPVSSLLEG